MTQAKTDWKDGKVVGFTCKCGWYGKVADPGLYICKNCNLMYGYLDTKWEGGKERAYTEAVQEIAKRQIRSREGIKGDLVELTLYDVLVFSDGRWAMIDVDLGRYYDDTPCLAVAGRYEYGMLDSLYRAGLISKEEKQAEEKAHYAAAKEKKEREKQDLYERLKREFEGGER